MGYQLTFEIKDLPMTTNSKSDRRWVRYAEMKKWLKLVRMATLGQIPFSPLKKAELELVRGSSRAPDFDGLVSSFKHPIDSLVKIGILENDKMDNIGQPKYHWEKVGPGKGFIRVTIRSVE